MENKFQAALAGMAAELAAEPQWQPYAKCLEIRAASGTFNKARKDALEEAAERFTEVARNWSYEERKRFSLWLMDRTGRVMQQVGRARNSKDGRSLVSPLAVIDAILLPTMDEWRELEPSNPEPNFWAGLYSLLSFDPVRHPVTCFREAIRLDPAYAPAREALARHVLDAISYNQHELPSGYLCDDPEDDLTSLREVEELLAEPVGPDIRSSLQERILTLRKAAENWIESRAKRTSRSPE